MAQAVHSSEPIGLTRDMVGAALLDHLLDGRPLQLVDVGARDGLHPRWDRYSSLIEAVGFDADREECTRLNARVGSGSKRRFLPYALGSADSEQTFHVCRGPGYSGFYEPNLGFVRSFAPEIQDSMEVLKTVRINATTLDAVAKAEQLRPDCLKIDVQGAELDILRGGTSVLATTKMVELEVEFNPQYRGQPLFADIDQFMRQQGFVLLGLRRTFWRRHSALADRAIRGGQLVHGDVLYYNASRSSWNYLDRRNLTSWLILMSAYRQDDFVAQLLSSDATGRLLDADDSGRLAKALQAQPPLLLTAVAGLLRPVVRHFNHRNVRAFVDACRDTPAIDWHDPDFF
jgi:FkbM family methyltransferase